METNTFENKCAVRPIGTGTEFELHAESWNVTEHFVAILKYCA